MMARGSNGCSNQLVVAVVAVVDAAVRVVVIAAGRVGRATERPSFAAGGPEAAYEGLDLRHRQTMRVRMGTGAEEVGSGSGKNRMARPLLRQFQGAEVLKKLQFY